MFVAALFTIAKMWKPKQPLTETDEWINKMWSTHTVESDSVIKRSTDFMWMNLGTLS